MLEIKKYNIFNSHVFAKIWIVFACFCLLLSGALALVITFAKMPYFKELVENIDIMRWCLATHVNLATLVWFTAFPVGLSFLVSSNENTKENISFLQLVGFIFSFSGVLLFVTALPGPSAEVIMSNYIPVVKDQQFYMGMALYALGVLLSFSSFQFLRRLLAYSKNKDSYGYGQVNFGVLIGVAFYFFAALSFLFALWELIQRKAPFNELFFERLMWGSGHILQHFNSVFVVVAWVLLLSSFTKKKLFTRQELFPVFAYLSLTFFVLPLLFFSSIESSFYQKGFTFLMQWGIAPAIVFFIFKALLKLSQIPQKAFGDYRYLAFLASIILMLIGFVFGIFIRGSDLRIPGHYHAVIGSISLCFMVLSYTILSKKGSSEKWIKRCIYTFTFGQILFSSALFVAGALGIERKTYGSEHTIAGIWQNITFASMALGGLLAFIGGLFFAIAILSHFDFKKLQSLSLK